MSRGSWVSLWLCACTVTPSKPDGDVTAETDTDAVDTDRVDTDTDTDAVGEETGGVQTETDTDTTPVDRCLDAVDSLPTGEARDLAQAACDDRDAVLALVDAARAALTLPCDPFNAFRDGVGYVAVAEALATPGGVVLLCPGVHRLGVTLEAPAIVASLDPASRAVLVSDPADEPVLMAATAVDLAVVQLDVGNAGGVATGGVQGGADARLLVADVGFTQIAGSAVVAGQGGATRVVGSRFVDGDAGAGEGAGVRAVPAGGSVVVLGSDFTDNRASRGGAIWIEGGASDAAPVVLAGSTFDGNFAQAAGAVGAFTTDTLAMVAADCTFERNVAAQLCGALYMATDSTTASLTVLGSTFTQNQALNAGALCALNGQTDVVLSDTTFEGNRSQAEGAGIYFNTQRGSLVLEDSALRGHGPAAPALSLFADQRFDASLVNVQIEDNVGGDEVVRFSSFVGAPVATARLVGGNLSRNVSSVSTLDLGQGWTLITDNTAFGAGQDANDPEDLFGCDLSGSVSFTWAAGQACP